MRTTIEIPDVLFRRVKLAALHRELTLKEWFTHALERALENEVAPARRMVRAPVGQPGEHHIPGRTNAELAVLLENDAPNPG